MSLIVDALKRAQQGAARALPPFAAGAGAARAPQPRLDTGDGEGSSKRLMVIVAVAAVVLGGAFAARTFLLRPRPTPMVEGAPLFVMEPVVEEPAADAADVAAAETPESLAGAAAEDLEEPGRSVASTRVARPRAVRPPPLVTVAAAMPPAVAPAAIPPATPAVVEVHALRTRDASDALLTGLSYQQRGDYGGAIEQYRRGIAADSRNPGLFNNLGLALKETGRLDEAARAFEDALNLDPKYEKALNNLGVTRYQQARYEDAIDLFTRAIKVNPANVQSYVNLGVIYLPAGRLDEALGAFQDALRYDPKSAEAHYNLGLLWDRRGDRERALPHYQKFVELADARHGDLVTRVKDYLRQFERRR